MPLKLVFFDLGDVVCQFVPERRLAAFVQLPPQLGDMDVDHIGQRVRRRIANAG